MANTSTEKGVVKAAGFKEIRGKERDYGNVLWKQPHLLDLSYSELEERNLEVKAERLSGATSDMMKEKFLQYLSDEKGIKALTVCFFRFGRALTHFGL